MADRNKVRELAEKLFVALSSEERQPNAELRERAREFFSDYSDSELLFRDNTLDRGKVIELLAAFASSIQAEGRQEIGVCGGAQNMIGGCGKELPFKDAYRCTDCMAYFHRDCLVEHCKVTDAVKNIRADECWRKDCTEEKANLAQQLAEARAALKQVANCSCEEGHTCVRVAREIAQAALKSQNDTNLSQSETKYLDNPRKQA